MILKNIKLKNELKKFSKNFDELLDVIVFGSVIKGKSDPSDIDILVLFEKKVDKRIEYELRKILESYYSNISIISKTKSTVLDSSFAARESILFEGFSLLTKDNLAQKYGFSSVGMFKYDFKDWDKLNKTKFYYALNGRGSGSGVIDSVNGIKLSDSVVLIPLENIEQFRDFLDSWRLEHIYVPILIPKRMNKQKILQMI